MPDSVAFVSRLLPRHWRNGPEICFHSRMGGSGIQLALIALGFVILWFTIVRPRRQLQSTTSSTSADRDAARTVRDGIDEIFVRLQEFSRETLARMDTKIRLLNQLINDADDRIRRLEALQSSVVAPPAPSQPIAAVEPAPAPAPPVAPPVAPAPGSPPPASPLHQRLYDLHDRGLTLPEIEAETGVEKGEIELILGMRRARG